MTALGRRHLAKEPILQGQDFADTEFGIQPLDAFTFAGAMVVMIVAALVAAYVPARRAARVDPVTALRAE